ncbi:MAG: glutaredoxin [Myxococcales bacterium]|nr:glutaredoxin [Myxococcales bacterium]
MSLLPAENDYHAAVPKLALYHYPSCYYCKIVRRALEQYDLDVELRDIHQNREWHDELVEARGRRTVPVMRIENGEGEVEWLGEADDIVRLLPDLAA